MKKPVIILLLIILITGSVIPGLSVFARTNYIPHEYPTPRERLVNEIELLSSYSLIGGLISGGRYQDAQKSLHELSNIELPESIRYVIDSYNILYENLAGTANKIGSLLDEASSLLSGNWAENVETILNEVQSLVQHAYFLLEDIKVVSGTLIEEISEVAGLGAGVSQAGNIAEGNISQLARTIDKFDERRRELADMYISISGLLPTEVSLNANRETLTVGEMITLSGGLTCNGGPLENKSLSIIIGKQTIETLTDETGTYSVDTSIPYEYVNSMRLVTIYEPEGADIYTYTATQSPPVSIDTFFYPTEIRISTPGEAYTGLPFIISGIFTGTPDGTRRTATVFIDNTILTEQDVTGSFNLDITIPENITPGKHSLNINIEPARQYAGARIARDITVLRPAIFSDIHSPSVVILPDTVEITGQVYTEEGPVAGATVRINVNNITGTTRTSQDGAFTGTVKIRTMPDARPLVSNPLRFIIPGDSTYNVSPVGVQQVEIIVESAVSLRTVSVTTIQLITVNPVTAAPIIIVFLYLGLLIYRRYSISHQAVIDEPGREPAVPVMVTRPGRTEYKLTGIRGRIFAAYRKGQRAVEKMTGVIMGPNLTLREYLGLAAIPPAYFKQFSELTALAESALYSGLNPPEDSAARAEEYADGIQEVLTRGNL